MLAGRGSPEIAIEDRRVTRFRPGPCALDPCGDGSPWLNAAGIHFCRERTVIARAGAWQPLGITLPVRYLSPFRLSIHTAWKFDSSDRRIIGCDRPVR